MAEAMETRLFISYSRTDGEFVRRLTEDLRQAGYTVWVDITGVRGGEQWVREIDEGVRGCDAFIVIVSPQSMASQWVMREVILALNQRKQTIPVLWRAAELPVNLIDLQYIDFRKDYDPALGELLGVLPEPPPPPGPRLPQELEMARNSGISTVRWGAVPALIDIARSDDPDLVALARECLESMVHTDPDERVRGAAQSFFDEEEAMRLAEEDRIQQAEVAARLEEARRLQDEAARAVQEAEEERLRLETQEKARQETLEHAQKAREIMPPSRAQISLTEDPLSPQPPPRRPRPALIWIGPISVIVAVLVGAWLSLRPLIADLLPPETPSPTSDVEEPAEGPETIEAPTASPEDEPAPEGEQISETPVYIEGEGPLFEDNFEDGNDDGWNYQGSLSAWTVIEDETGNYVLRSTAPDWTQARNGENSWLNYALEYDFRVIEGTSTPNEADDTAANIRQGSRRSECSYSMTNIGISRRWGGISGQAGTADCAWEVFTDEYQPIVMEWQIWNHLRIEAFDARITVYLNGEEKLFTDRAPVLSGYFSFQATPGATVEYDNVRVVELLPAQ